MNDDDVGRRGVNRDGGSNRRCSRCGTSLGREDGVVQHSADDPLEVRECANCGAVVSVGGHHW